MPILWEQFTIWFKNNIIKQQKDKYLFRNFFEDVFKSLIGPSLGSNCNEFSRVNFPKLEFTVLDLGELPPGSKAESIFQAAWKDKAEVPVKDIEKALKGRLKSNWIKPPCSGNRYKTIVMLYLRPMRVKRDANKEQDANDGVYWLELGKANGVLLDYSFSKNDAPYLVEAKTLGQGALGADLAGGAIYNFSCTMLGSGFFKPGQLIYIDPAQLQRYGGGVSIGEIRLGGYYVVDSVKLSVKSGEFITSIDATWQSPGQSRKSKKKIGSGDEKKSLAEVERLSGKNTAKYIYSGAKT